MKAFIKAIAAWVWDVVSQWLLGAWSFVIDWIVWVWSWMADVGRSTLPDGLLQQMDAIPWSQFADYWNDVAWILPLREVLLIIAATVLLSANIRLIRWFLGIITLGGG